MKTLNIDGERCFTVVHFAKSVGLDADIFSVETDKVSMEAVARRCTNPQYLLYREADLLRFCEWLHQQGQIAGRYVDLHKAVDDHIDHENAKVEKEVNAEQEEYTWVKPDACKVTATLDIYPVVPELPISRKLLMNDAIVRGLLAVNPKYRLAEIAEMTKLSCPTIQRTRAWRELSENVRSKTRAKRLAK